MGHGRIGQRVRLWLGTVLVTAAMVFPGLATATTEEVSQAEGSPAPAAEAGVVAAREDYFISPDTVIIGCTAGMAAGILVGSVPVTGALMSGIGVPESVNLLINLAGMGCGVGAVSSAVAIFTAWMLETPK